MFRILLGVVSGGEMEGAAMVGVGQVHLPDVLERKNINM